MRIRKSEIARSVGRIANRMARLGHTNGGSMQWSDNRYCSARERKNLCAATAPRKKRIKAK